MRGLQCHESLWLYRNRPELRNEPDEAQQAVFDAGSDVGLLARGLFAGGTEIIYRTGFNRLVKETKELITNGAETIYEAAFRHNDVIVMADILHKGSSGWEVYEVKSSTSVKDTHLYDLAIQYYVIKGSGLDVSKASIVHINREYVRRGAIDVSALFTIADMTGDAMEHQKSVEDELRKMKEMLSISDTKPPAVKIGPQCEDPYPCDFGDHCWTGIDVVADMYGGTIFDLRGRGIDKFDCYNRGILMLTDLVLSELNEKQRMQVEVELSGKKVILAASIRRFLDTLSYPLYFLDFETFMAAVPPFEGLRPYEQIPFQYSLHWQESPEAELKHSEFLAEAGVDGREALAKSLADSIPDNACVVAYNKGFERFVLAGLAEAFPQYAKELMNIYANLVDLMEPFRNRHYYTKEMKGSYSLKEVLPALVPDLKYEGMEISNAGDASLSYSGLCLIEDKDEAQKIRRALLEYCKLDTFGMVKLVEKLREAAEQGI